MPGLLTVDAGNSTLDLMLHPVGRRRRFARGEAGGAALQDLLGDAFPDACMAVTVRDGALDDLLRELRARNVPCRVVGEHVMCPLPLDYATPKTLGADRWLGALAAHRRFGRAVVVDCGSATTVNLVEADGTFRGGPIAPGLGALQSGMAGATPALPAARLDAMPTAPPRSSQDAVDTGVVSGFCGMIERLVTDTLRAARGPANVVVTGGRGEVLLRHGRLRAHHVPDLVHQGLALLHGERACRS